MVLAIVLAMLARGAVTSAKASVSPFIGRSMSVYNHYPPCERFKKAVILRIYQDFDALTKRRVAPKFTAVL